MLNYNNQDYVKDQYSYMLPFNEQPISAETGLAVTKSTIMLLTCSIFGSGDLISCVVRFSIGLKEFAAVSTVSKHF